LADVEQIQQESIDDIVAVMPERDLRAAYLDRGRV
jgi:hypothetical protein